MMGDFLMGEATEPWGRRMVSVGEFVVLNEDKSVKYYKKWFLKV
jgi:hypothetical protein